MMWLALLLPIVAHAVSSGNLPYCNVDMKIGKGTAIMKWVQVPVVNTRYVLSGGVAGKYTPGVLNPITLEVLDLDLQYIGLVLVALNVSSGLPIGKWTVRQGDEFHLPPGCSFQAVTHTGANLKPFITTFYWSAPAGTGSVMFRALIKQGEQAKGNFYWPNNLTLTEGTAATGAQSVFKGASGASCDQTCAVKGQACDGAATLALSTAAALSTATDAYYACRKPLVKGCGTPMTGDKGYCYYNSCGAGQTFDAATACTRRSVDPLMDQPFCACKAGAAKYDETPPTSTSTQILGYQLEEPFQLSMDITLEQMTIQDGTVTVEVTGPADHWFGIGWNATFMKGTYATVVNIQDPTILNPQITIGDKGYQDGINGWYDVKCQQALNDYCRNVGNSPNIFFSCALAGSTNQGTGSGVYLAANTSRVPCKGGKPSPYAPMTVAEYFLNDNPRGGVKINATNSNNITVISTFTNNGQMTIKFARPIDGPSHKFPSNVSSFPIIWAVGVHQSFVVGIPHAKKAETLVTLKLSPIYPECVGAGASTLPSLLVLALLGTLSTRSVFFGALLALFVQPALAHNWVNTPSRALIAAVSVPCQARVDPAPHLQVSVGQTFHMEWSTGHGDTPTVWTYWVFLHEDDYDQLRTMTEGDLEAYLDRAPTSALLTDQLYQKRHLAPWRNSYPGCEGCNNFGTTPGLFEQQLLSTDARFLTRNPVAVRKSIMYGDPNVTQWWWPQASRQGDKRAQYKSSAFPWIISAHKFKIINHYPNEYDISTFTFPSAPKGPGNYIAHFYWGGYRDCVDVNIVGAMTANPWGQMPGANLTSTFAKLDHCEYTHVLNPTGGTNCRVMKNASAADCLNDCLRANSIYGCTGVQAVPFQNYAGTFDYTPNWPGKKYTYIDTGMFPPPELGPCDSRTVHKRVTCPDANTQCAITTAAPGDYICYSLIPYRDQDFQVAEDYVIATDWKDPKYYSTCWVRLSPGGFLDYPLPKPQKPSWNAGSKCLLCDWMKNTLAKYPDTSAPRWADGLTTDCQNCDLPVGADCVPDITPVDEGNAGTCANPGSSTTTCSAACDPGFNLFGAARTCADGVWWGGKQSCVYAGC